MRYIQLLSLFILINIPYSGRSQPAIKAYIEKYKDLAISMMNESGIPASIILSIAIVETGGGTSRNCRLLKNHFGIVAGKKYKIPGTTHITAYKTFESDTASYRYFCRIIGKKKFYSKLKENMNYSLWVNAIANSGYAAAHHGWIKGVNSVIKRNKLYEYDKKMGPTKVLSKEKIILKDAANPYGLDLIRDTAAFHTLTRLDSNNILVDLKSYIPHVLLDIRYASDSNFTKKRIYTAPKAYLRLKPAKALRLVQQELADKGLGIKIFDAYRPYSATLLFYETMKDTIFVAAPWKGSKHNRGCAIDLTLVHLTDSTELNMPTAFDDFSPKASPTYQDLAPDVRQNRDMLIRLMEKYGFSVYPDEWWHFDFQGWSDYGLLDIPFEQLQ